MFEVLWQFAVVRNPQMPPGQGLEPTPGEYELLAMLAAGMTDRQIADRSGFSLRTAQTKVRSLLTVLGADIRFQAGLGAKARGWI